MGYLWVSGCLGVRVAVGVRVSVGVRGCQGVYGCRVSGWPWVSGAGAFTGKGLPAVVPGGSLWVTVPRYLGLEQQAAGGFACCGAAGLGRWAVCFWRS